MNLVFEPTTPGLIMIGCGLLVGLPCWSKYRSDEKARRAAEDRRRQQRGGRR
jgi:hypothetical protein